MVICSSNRSARHGDDRFGLRERETGKQTGSMFACNIVRLTLVVLLHLCEQIVRANSDDKGEKSGVKASWEDERKGCVELPKLVTRSPVIRRPPTRLRNIPPVFFQVYGELSVLRFSVRPYECHPTGSPLRPFGLSLLFPFLILPFFDSACYQMPTAACRFDTFTRHVHIAGLRRVLVAHDRKDAKSFRGGPQPRASPMSDLLNSCTLAAHAHNARTCDRQV